MEARVCILIFLAILASHISTTQQQKCLSNMDLVFVMDGSNSMGEANFEKQKASLVNLVTTLSINEQEVLGGLVLFSGGIHAVVNLTSNKESFINAIKALIYPDEETRTDMGIDTAISMFNTSGRNGSVSKVMIIITDGGSTLPNLTAVSATKAKNLGIIIFAVGVTNATDANELNTIATDKNKVIITADFTTLESSLNNATNRACVDLQTTVKPPVTECQDAVIDIVFLMSVSNIEESNFEEMKTFVHDFLFFADVDNGKIRVGLITFTDKATVQFNLNTYSTKSAMINAINSLKYMPGNTNITEAFRVLRTGAFTKNNGDRADVPNVGILLSTNDENINTAQAFAEADMARGAGIQIYGIGLGHKTTTLLDGIVSRPQAENRFMVDRFPDLRSLIPQVYDKFNKFCENPPPVPACYMGQTDLWLVVDVSETSESLSRVQATGDFQQLKNGLLGMIETIQDPSVANPGVRLGLITYSETSMVAVDVSMPDSVNSTASAVQQLPGDISQGGASLVSALRSISQPPVMSSYLSYVAIVAPESSYMSNMTGLEAELARLKGIGFTIVIFAVMENGSLDQKALHMEASGSKIVYYIPRYLDLEAAAKNFTRDRLCNGRLENSTGLCAESGHKENGVGVVAHPMDCDKYIQCYFDERNNRDIAVVRHCPMGLHWHAENMTCSEPCDAMCANDRCKEDCASYKMEGACGAYWECEDGMSMPKCCQHNYTFTPDLGCQPDDSCTDTCSSERWCGKCQKKPNWMEPAGYDVMILGGHLWMPRPCFYEDFDIVDCDCTAPRGYVCPADRIFSFNDSLTMKDIEDGVKEGIRASDVQKTSDGISLGHKSAVHVKVNKMESDSKPFTLEFRFREMEDFSPYGETLVSSGMDCGSGSKLLISANDQFVYAEIRSSNGVVSEVKVPTKGLNKDDFKDLVLSYNDGVLALSIKDEQTQYIAKTQAPHNFCFSCGLDFGQGLNKLSFHGDIQKIAVYSCAWPLLY